MQDNPLHEVSTGCCDTGNMTMRAQFHLNVSRTFQAKVFLPSGTKSPVPPDGGNRDFWFQFSKPGKFGCDPRCCHIFPEMGPISE